MYFNVDMHLHSLNLSPVMMLWKLNYLTKHRCLQGNKASEPQKFVMSSLISPFTLCPEPTNHISISARLCGDESCD